MRSGIRPTLADLEIERVDWRELGPEFYRTWGYPRGKFDPEHLTVYGKSGGGKTKFVGEILSERARLRGSHVVVCATKRTDATIKSWQWPEITQFPPDYGVTCSVFWARPKGISAAHRITQRAKVKSLMDSLWVENSNIVVYWDELAYIERMLRLNGEMENFYREGRSLGITNVASMQRPAGVNRYAHSEPGWSVGFKPKDADDRDRVAEVFGDRARFRAAFDLLDPMEFEFLMRRDRDGQTFVSHLPH